MAVMYPSKPKECTAKSQEGAMFEALSKLSDEYYVFHSFAIVSVDSEKIVHESETDFVIFHPKKGILCLEAKAGRVKYENGEWFYGSGISMSHDGPFHQASNNKWKLKRYIENRGLGYLLERCKLMHAVWFPTITKKHFNGVYLPAEADAKLMLTKDDMDDIEGAIARIFDYELSSRVETDLTSSEVKTLLNKVLAPSFNLISISEMTMNHRRDVFKAMLREQVALLDYLEEQNTAVINGMAGTGKTIMAVEKAKRHADKGEEVLFLCYNQFLKDYLREAYRYEHVSYFTIDGFACKMCDTESSDYGKLQEVILDLIEKGAFPYKHVIIDEGQDFGREDLDESDVIELLKLAVLDDEEKGGTFYVFYDKNQMVQSDKIPSYISEADCKLTLYRNCRNTRNIATSSLRLLQSDKMPKLYDGALEGEAPEMYVVQDESSVIEALNSSLASIREEGYEDIQILTCKKVETSAIVDFCEGGMYIFEGKKIPFTTCRKYKGLEADAIVLIDMDMSIYEQCREKILYVGSSRARYKLSIISMFSTGECNELIESAGGKKTKKPQRALATMFNAKYKEVANKEAKELVEV